MSEQTIKRLVKASNAFTAKKAGYQKIVSNYKH